MRFRWVLFSSRCRDTWGEVGSATRRRLQRAVKPGCGRSISRTRMLPGRRRYCTNYVCTTGSRWRKRPWRRRTTQRDRFFSWLLGSSGDGHEWELGIGADGWCFPREEQVTSVTSEAWDFRSKAANCIRMRTFISFLQVLVWLSHWVVWMMKICHFLVTGVSGYIRYSR